MQSTVYKSMDTISLWQFSLHCRLNVQFITVWTIEVRTNTTADLVTVDYSRRIFSTGMLEIIPTNFGQVYSLRKGKCRLHLRKIYKMGP